MTENKVIKSWAARVTGSRAVRWAVGMPVALALVLFIASFFLDGPLRSTLEKKLNSDLKGYSVRLPGLHFQLLAVSP
jgi:hypothetical protein